MFQVIIVITNIISILIYLTSCHIFPGDSVKNPSTMPEAQVQSLGQVGPLEEGMAPHSTILAWRIPMDRRAWRVVHGVAMSQIWLNQLNKHTRRHSFSQGCIFWIKKNHLAKNNALRIFSIPSLISCVTLTNTAVTNGMDAADDNSLPGLSPYCVLETVLRTLYTLVHLTLTQESISL